MYPNRFSLDSRPLIALALVVSWLFVAGDAEGRLLLLESPLAAHAPLAADSRRLEFGSEYFGAGTWAGQRHHFRYAGSRGRNLVWSISLPWLYSSYANGGRSGRDNLQIGGALGLSRAHPERLRLGGDFWFPFSDDALYPLAQRRAFARLALLSRFGGEGGALSLAFAYRREAVGFGPDAEGPAWSEQIQGEWTLDRRVGANWRLGLEGGLSHAFDEDLSWADLGAALSLRWSSFWSVELSGRVGLGEQAEPDRQDYALRLTFRRDRPLPDESPEQDAPSPAEGEEPGGGKP